MSATLYVVTATEHGTNVTRFIGVGNSFADAVADLAAEVDLVRTEKADFQYEREDFRDLKDKHGLLYEEQTMRVLGDKHSFAVFCHAPLKELP